jgi:hypothetical protein
LFLGDDRPIQNKDEVISFGTADYEIFRPSRGMTRMIRLSC